MIEYSEIQQSWVEPHEKKNTLLKSKKQVIEVNAIDKPLASKSNGIFTSKLIQKQNENIIRFLYKWVFKDKFLFFSENSLQGIICESGWIS